MRLQLIAALAMLAAPAAAAAQVEEDPARAAEASLRVYADDDHVTVWSPAAHVLVPLPHQVVATVDTTIDAVTAASIDVTTAASPYAFDERRIEGRVAVRVPLGAHQWLTPRAAFSDEHDYTSLLVGASWLTELARRNATLELGAAGAFDTVGRAGDPAFAEARRTVRLTASYTQVTDRRGYLDVVVDADRATGYLAAPYRYVPIEMGGVVGYALPERVPDRHAALAALVRVRRELAPSWYARADYRLYRDTWDLTSHTVSARATRALRDDELLVGVEARGYLQSGAAFWRPRYAGDDGAPAWRTRDRTLGPMWSVLVGVIADAFLPWRDARASASAAVIRFAWPDDPWQRHRRAVITSVSLEMPF